MNYQFSSVEDKMVEEMMRKGVITGKRGSDKKKYLKELIQKLYMTMM